MARKMKDSGIEWIGEIPEDWKVNKYKRYTKNGMGSTILKNDLKEIGIPVYSATQKGEIFGYVDKANVVLSKGDFVIPARGNSIGYVYMVNENIATSTQTTIYSKVNQNINNAFLFYQSIGLKDYWFEFDNTAIPQITVEQVENNIVLVPPQNEQNKIANFLDQKISEIDGIKKDIEKEIEVLEDYKKSIIYEAVTKGLDKNAEIKDSGVEWIGEIPRDWKVGAIGKFTENYSGGTPSRNRIDYWENGEVLWVSSGEINKSYIYDSTERITQLGYKNSSAKMFPINTVLVALNGQGKTKGMTAILKVEATTNQSLTGFICDEEKLHYRYLYYAFKATYEYNRSYYAGGDKRDGIAASDLRRLKVPLPNINEQINISNFIDKNVNEINEVVIDKKEQLQVLDEYKKSMIYEYVTGKKAVE